MNNINKEFILNNIEEIKAFCEGKDVEYCSNICISDCNGSELNYEWFDLDESDLLIIAGTNPVRCHKLRIKPKKKFVYVNTYNLNNNEFIQQFSSLWIALSAAVKDHESIEYLSIAVKTEVDNE